MLFAPVINFFEIFSFERFSFQAAKTPFSALLYHQFADPRSPTGFYFISLHPISNLKLWRLSGSR